MRCMRCGKQVEFDSAVCVACDPLVSGMGELRKRKRASALRQGLLGLIVVALLAGAPLLMQRWGKVPPPPRKVARRPAGATQAPKTPPRQPNRDATRPAVKAASVPDRDPTLPYAPARQPAAPPATHNAPAPVAYPSPPVVPQPGGEPVYARTDVAPPQPTQNGPRAERPEAVSQGRAVQDASLVVGIVRVQRYPKSCVLWGYIYNATGAKIDMDVAFRLRDAQGDLCQKAMTQFQGQEWTIHDDQMLYFWPAFTWNSLADGAPEGYANGRKAAEMGALEVSVAGRRFVLTVDDDTTSLGPLRTLEAGLEHRIRMQLGSFPDNYLGTQPMGR